jgi:3-oxoacyl-[acyl-carrier protein] reductase
MVNLEISGRHALVCAASKGLGKACATALALEGVHVTINARNQEALEAAAAEIQQEAGISVSTIACDITSRDGQDAALASLPVVDILVTNAGGPPPGDFRDWSREDWTAGLAANMLTPIELIRRVIDGMIERNFGRIVNITSSAVKAPIPFLGLSNGARAGLTGFVAGLARQVARHNVTINNLLPSYHATDRLPDALKYLARQHGGDIEAATRAVLEQIPAGRFGSPAEFGRSCAFLCAASSGYVTGQNLMLDGGAYPGTFG